MPSSDFYLLGILNSKAVWTFLGSICSVLGDVDKGGRLRLIYQYIERIPIPPASKKDSNQIKKLVKTILSLKQDLSEAFGLKQKTDIEDKITECEHEIDKVVNRLYGLKK